MIATVISESLTKWIEENQLSANFIDDQIVEIEGVGKFLLIEPKNLALPDGTKLTEVIFDQEFQINLSDEENELVDQVDYLLFQFGNRFYYVNDLVPEEINEFKYLGKANLTFNDTKFPYLGVHGEYELCNGSREYKEWTKKAKFLGVECLGICEENTLAGTLAFQEECEKAKIKPIIGETITILTESKAKMNVKLFVQDEEGWINLLKINKMINVDNGGEYIREDQLFNRNIATEGLILVLTPEVDIDHYWNNRKFDYYFANVYYQLDFSEWSSNERDEKWLKAIKNYFDNYLMVEGNNLPPILLCDSYYLDKNDFEIRKILNSIGKVGFKYQSKDQHFKSIDEIYLQFTQLFAEDDERWNIILDLAIENLNEMVKEIDFNIPVGDFRLPEYEMTEEEKGIYKDNEEMFFELINQGLEQKIIGKVKNEVIYFDRVQEEIEVIKRGGFISYFLMLRDILEWCKRQGIWVGMGRGSAAGSLVSYLLDIVKIDPIHYKLLFSRFLNAGRIGKSLPDVDLDFEGGRRDDVKRYMESRYGKDYVAAIGTYGTFKIKSALKDLSRDAGVDYTKTNFVASLIDDAKVTFTGLFKMGASKPELKQFIQKNHKVIERMPMCLNQVKNSSIHASGVVVVPKSKGLDIYSQMPIKQIDGVLVSEWEGTLIDKAGFLKFDILGVKQLDKFNAITKLIKENKGIDISYDNMDLEDPEVFQLFKDGFSEDVFQFGTTGLKAYCKEMKPDNVEDLIAAVALYRPGPMDTGMHKKYVSIKHGIEKPIYDEGTFNATQETYGIAVYQEQVMQITKDVAGFDLVMADDVRKAMGKKDKKLLEEYKDKFINGGKEKGFKHDYLADLWAKLETFAGYGFNRSHAACYAIMGYFSQWLKLQFPVEFWTVALQFSDDKEIINRISEISKISNIDVEPVDINKSTTTFFADYETKKIYWAMNSIKWVGEKAVEEILQERKENGSFYSIEDFCDRINARKKEMKENDERSGINKRTITNLILAGAFDKVEKITPEKRGVVIKKYYSFINQDLTEELIEAEKWKPYQWVLKQKELTGFGYIDYKKIVSGSKTFATKQKKFEELGDLADFTDYDKYSDVVIAGVVQEIHTWNYKNKKGKYCNLMMIDNTNTMRVTFWADEYEKFKEELENVTGKLIIMNGKLVHDSYKDWNNFFATGKTQIEII